MAAPDATAYQMHVGPENTGLLKVRQNDETAKKVTELLQRDLKEHHVFYNDDGFHDHVIHHLLALYGTAATAPLLQKAFDGNASYQRRVLPTHDGVVDELSRSWDDNAAKYLRKEEYYPDFLAFFQREIDAKGWPAVMEQRVFKGDKSADDLLVRLYSGFLHPLIQLMYGVEFSQPAIVAQALAQACVHGDDIRPYLVQSESLAASSAEKMPSIVSLYEAVAADAKLAAAAHMGDANKIRDGVLGRAKDEMLRVGGRVRVSPEEVDERTAEMFDAAVYVAAAAALKPGKHIKIDFFLMHHINSAPIFLTINAQSWIPAAVKARLIEWKIRMDLIEYAGRACPPLLPPDRIAAYRPKDPSGSTPLEVISRLHHFDDDGHAIKLGRAALICQNQLRGYGDRDWVRLRGDEVWMKVHHMIVDSVAGGGAHWVRTTGLEEAWKNIADEPETRL